MVAGFLCALWMWLLVAQSSGQLRTHLPAIPLGTDSPAVASPPLLTLPFQYQKRHIYLIGSINGHPGMVLLLDSGSSESGLDVHTAQALRLAPGPMKNADIGLGDGATFVASPIRVRIGLGPLSLSQKMLLVELSGLEQVSGQRIDGILGAPFFKRYVVELNFHTHILKVFAPAHYQPRPQDTPIPISMKHNVPIVASTLFFGVNQRLTADLELDTGSDDTLLLYRSFEEKHHLQRKIPWTGTGTGYGLGGKYNVELCTLGAVRVGTIQANRLDIAFSTANHGVSAKSRMDGEIGNGLLEKTRTVIVDVPDRELFFEWKAPRPR